MERISGAVNGILKFMDRKGFEYPKDTRERSIYINSLIKDFFHSKLKWISDAEGNPMELEWFDNSEYDRFDCPMHKNAWIVQCNFNKFRNWLCIKKLKERS